jgi:hypothetical protein
MVVVRLRERLSLDKLKYMSRFTFAALVSVIVTSAAAAQQVPGRDLLEFPVGLLAEPPALSSRMPAGLWNPAAASLPANSRGTIGFAGLMTPSDQGVSLAMLAGEVRVRRDLIATLSLAQASVQDIFRTNTDPTTNFGEIPYSTTVVSLGAAAARGPLSVGVAGRFRHARFDAERSGVLSVDAGAVLNRVAGTPIRIAASTFLFSPSRSKESATYSFATDIPVFQRDSAFVVRGGYSASQTEHRGHEDYGFAAATYRQVDASAGVARLNAYGHISYRLRLGIGLRYAGYNVAFGREDGAAGVEASYQVLVTRAIR